jgi:hypothetical protein
MRTFAVMCLYMAYATALPAEASLGADAAANRYVLHVVNGVGPGLNPSWITVRVKSGDKVWSDQILYHSFRPYGSRSPSFHVRVQWRTQTIEKTYRVSEPGRVPDLSVKRNPRTGKLYFNWDPN